MKKIKLKYILILVISMAIFSYFKLIHDAFNELHNFSVERVNLPDEYKSLFKVDSIKIKNIYSNKYARKSVVSVIKIDTLNLLIKKYVTDSEDLRRLFNFKKTSITETMLKTTSVEELNQLEVNFLVNSNELIDTLLIQPNSKIDTISYQPDKLIFKIKSELAVLKLHKNQLNTLSAKTILISSQKILSFDNRFKIYVVFRKIGKKVYLIIIKTPGFNDNRIIKLIK